MVQRVLRGYGLITETTSGNQKVLRGYGVLSETTSSGETHEITQAVVSIAGQSLTVKQVQRVTILPAVVSLSGQSLNVKQIQKIAINSAVVSLSGQSLNVKQGQKVTVNPASVALSGQQLTVKTRQNVTVNHAVVSITGQSLEVTEGSAPNIDLVEVEHASVGITGQALTVKQVQRVTILPAVVSIKPIMFFYSVNEATMVTLPETPPLKKRTALLSTKELSVLRSKSIICQRLKNVCDNQMSLAPQPVATFSPDTIYSTTLGVNPIKDKFYLDSERCYRHALCYLITDDLTYAKKAQSYLDAWSKTLRKIAGSTPQGYIGFHIQYFIIAACWVRGVDGWNGNYFEDWLDKYIKFHTRDYRFNNIGAYGTFFDICVASYKNDLKTLSYYADYWQNQVLEQIDENGIMIHEVTREGTDGIVGESGISYSNVSALAWTLGAEMLMKEGFNVYDTEAGARFRLAMGKLAGWVLNPASFPYYESTDLSKMTGVDQVTYVHVLKKYWSDPDMIAMGNEDNPPNSFLLDFIFGYIWNPTAEIASID